MDLVHGIENEGSTASDTITFTFSGHITPENIEFDGQAFYCQLDSNLVEVCPGVHSESEPGVFYRFENLLPGDLPPGPHSF